MFDILNVYFDIVVSSVSPATETNQIFYNIFQIFKKKSVKL